MGVILVHRGSPWPIHQEDELAAALDVLASGKTNYWTGQVGRSFEAAFAEFIGVERAVFIANGTLALELALLSLQLPAGSEVITTPRTYVATATSILRGGLRPVFADIDPLSGNITAESVKSVLSPRTSAVVVVHSAGWPADMPAFQELCDVHGLALVEDCAQAHGARIDGQSVGSFGDVAAWSFCQDKIITTGGEGGMVTTSRRDLADWIWAYKDHGKSWTKVYEMDHPPGFRWLHDSLGTNMRGTEVQAAIGLVQLGKISNWHEQRSTNARLLAGAIKHLPGIDCPMPPEGVEHAFYRLNARYTPEKELGRDELLAKLAERDLPVFSGSCSEVYLEGVFQNLGCAPSSRLPEAEAWTRESLAFLVHPGLTSDDLNTVAGGLAEALNA